MKYEISHQEIMNKIEREENCEHLRTTYNNKGAWCTDCGKTWGIGELVDVMKIDSRIKTLQINLKTLKEVFPRMRKTLEILCKCGDGGVNSLSLCEACKFKQSFNQDLEI